jgi:NAD-dependent DNA ligase
MKLKDIKIGDTVYIKKSNRLGEKTDIPRIVQNIEIRKNKHNRIILYDINKKFNAGELSDISCNKMTCNNCKYHKKGNV